MIRKLLVAAGANLLLFCSAHAAVVPGELLGVFSGNDTEAGILNSLGLQVEMLARVNTPGAIDSDNLETDGLQISGFALNSDSEATAGEWSYSGPGIATLIVLKVSNQYAVYLYNDAITDSMPNMGSWSTADLDSKGLSHITAYSVVPIPAAGWLMLSALGLLGVRRRKG